MFPKKSKRRGYNTTSEFPASVWKVGVYVHYQHFSENMGNSFHGIPKEDHCLIPCNTMVMSACGLGRSVPVMKILMQCRHAKSRILIP